MVVELAATGEDPNDIRVWKFVREVSKEELDFHHLVKLRPFVKFVQDDVLESVL